MATSVQLRKDKPVRCSPRFGDFWKKPSEKGACE
jgi:hypothetical protein